MKAFFKYIGLFIFLVAAIVVANMTYDYIKVCYLGNVIEQGLEEVK